MLFTYDPFYELNVPALPGPIFVHAENCERYDEDAGFPKDLRAHALTLDVYGGGRRLIAEEHVADGNIEPRIDEFLKNPDVQYIHVRDKEAGCYDLRIERRE